MEQIQIDDFLKLDIRVCTVLSAEKLPDSDKLLKLIFDIGAGEKRQVLSGIASVYPDPSVLVGQQIPVILNLAPRTMRGEVSNGMILAASALDDSAVLLTPIKPVLPGSKVR
ncbi:MAG: methionine--tRNA ligase subunit beta [Candidatus Paceibacteria bacterium]